MMAIKGEGKCCCCFSKNNLFSLLEPYNVDKNVEIYSTMIAECFQLSSNVEEHNRHLYLICKNCVHRLKDAAVLRSQIEIAYDRLQVECPTKIDQGDISSEHSDVVEPKKHKLECDMNVDSGASLSNENVLKPCKILLEKIDNKTMENVLIVSANGESGAKSRPSNIYFCNICKKIFKYLRAIQKHRILHLNIQDFICNYCKRQFTHKSDLKRHVLLHMGATNNKCDLCNKCFLSKINLESHRRTVHSLSCTSIKCKISESSFATRSEHNAHKKIHDKIQWGTKGFREKCSLKEPIMSHVGIKNFKCDLCDESFVSKIALAYHKNQCRSIRLSCYICSKTLHSEHKLKDHVLLHSVIKKYKCELCEKSFVTLCSFSNHKKMHFISTKICKYCNKEFKKKNIPNLLHHEKIQFDIKDLICDHCWEGI